MEELKNSNAKSIYIHIPFCKSKCNYCAFVSFPNADRFQDNYTNSLCEEIASFSSSSEIRTVYLGGGTPNTLSLNNVEKIFSALRSNFSIANDAEITFEANPKLSDVQYYKELKNFGINRISFGVQSFNDEILKTLNRIHSAESALKGVSMLQEAGFTNYSIDLIYGIFGQTLEDVKNDLKLIKNLNLNHVSTYGLKIEENTPFEKFDKTNLPDEELNEKMYLLISEELANMGFEHYEISNFAKKGFESKHNLTYWRNQEYFGFGTSAHGYLNGIRYKNSSSLEKYIENPLEKEILNRNTDEDTFEETIFLGLRLKDGINLEKIKTAFGVDLLVSKEKEIKKFIENGLVILQGENLSLTVKGFLISNYIMGELLG